MGWTLQASDDFNRPNENPIGAPWSLCLGGSPGLLWANTYSNQGGAANGAMHSVVLANDQKFKATFLPANNVGGAPFYIGLRSVGSLATYLLMTTVSGTIQMSTHLGNLGAAIPAVIVAGDIIEFEVLGVNANVYVNTILLGTRAVGASPVSGQVWMGSNYAHLFPVFDDVFIYDQLPASKRFRYEIISF